MKANATQAQGVRALAAGQGSERPAPFALFNAVRRGDVGDVQRLIAAGVDLNQKDPDHDAPLIVAADRGHTEILELLLAAGADVHVTDNFMDATALHAAAFAGHPVAAELLLHHGAELNPRGPYNGNTPLHDAIWNDHPRVAKVLLDAGADLSIVSKRTQSANGRMLRAMRPLEYARHQRNRPIVEIILARLAKDAEHAEGERAWRRFSSVEPPGPHTPVPQKPVF